MQHRGSCVFAPRRCLLGARPVAPPGRQRCLQVQAKKGFAKRGQSSDAAQKGSGGKAKQKTRKAAPSNILAPAPPSPNSREEQFMRQMESDRSGITADNLEFEQRLEKLRKQGEAVQRQRPKPAQADPLAAGPLAAPQEQRQPSAAKKAEEQGSFGAPQIAVGVISLGLAVVLAVTSLSDGPGPVVSPEELGLSQEQRQQLEARVKQLEAAVKAAPADIAALRELSDLSAALGQLKRSSELAERVTQADPMDAQAWLALADARVRLSDYRGAATAYEKSLEASAAPSLGQLQGLAGALVGQKKQAEAVQRLQGFEAAVSSSSSSGGSGGSGGLGPVELQLLIGKVYSQWERHFASALAVYDGIIEKYPDDFRGYLAKGALLKDNGRKGDAQRMFIQARFLAPPEARAVVDQVANR